MAGQPPDTINNTFQGNTENIFQCCGGQHLDDIKAKDWTLKQSCLVQHALNMPTILCMMCSVYFCVAWNIIGSTLSLFTYASCSLFVTTTFLICYWCCWLQHLINIQALIEILPFCCHNYCCDVKITTFWILSQWCYNAIWIMSRKLSAQYWDNSQTKC